MSSVCSNSMHLVEIFVLKRSARQPNLPDTNLPRTSQRMSLSRPIAKISSEKKSLGPGSPFPENPFVAIPVESKIFVRSRELRKRTIFLQFLLIAGGSLVDCSRIGLQPRINLYETRSIVCRLAHRATLARSGPKEVGKARHSLYFSK